MHTKPLSRIRLALSLLVTSALVGSGVTLLPPSAERAEASGYSVDYSASFSSGSVLETRSHLNFNPANAFSVEAWIRPIDSVVPQSHVIDLSSNSSFYFKLSTRISANQVKVYIKFPEMGANYQIKLQKNDGKWSRKMSNTITSTADLDLLVVGNAYYLVRTLELPGEGRYRIEVTVDGERMLLNGKDRPVVFSYRLQVPMHQMSLLEKSATLAFELSSVNRK